MNKGILKQNKDGSFHSEIKQDNNLIMVRVNDEYNKMLDAAMIELEQSKRATVLKQLAIIGFECISRPETKAILSIIFDNKRRNKKTGIVEFL